MRNFNEFKYDDVKYTKMYNTIIKYIRTCLKTEDSINNYVPNTHIASVFREVLVYLELEHMYPYEFHNDYTYVSQETVNGKEVEVERVQKIDYYILKNLVEGEYFNSRLLKENSSEEIHRVYQVLRETKDYIRNVMKLANITLSDTIMSHKVSGKLKAHAIRIKI